MSCSKWAMPFVMKTPRFSWSPSLLRASFWISSCEKMITKEAENAEQRETWLKGGRKRGTGMLHSSFKSFLYFIFKLSDKMQAAGHDSSIKYRKFSAGILFFLFHPFAWLPTQLPDAHRQSAYHGRKILTTFIDRNRMTAEKSFFVQTRKVSHGTI